MISSRNDQAWNTLVASLTLARLKTFFSSLGWEIRDKSLQRAALFVSPPDTKGNDLRFVIPEADDSLFDQAVLQLFKGLAVVRGYEFDEAINELKTFLETTVVAHQAAMRIKIGSDNKRSISLVEIEGVVKHARQALAHSIGCEIRQPYAYTRRVSNEASETAQRFEFGPTQAGSFILVIRAPVHTAAQTTLATERPLIEPEVKGLLRLARGLKWLSNNEVPQTFEDAWNESIQGLNANMAEHLYDMVDALRSSSCGLYFNFSNDIPAELKPAQQYFPLGPAMIHRLLDLKKILTEPDEVELTFTAKIVGIQSEHPLQEQLTHKITVEILEAENPKHRDRRLSMWIDRGDFIKATNVFPTGRPIKITGTFLVSGSVLEIHETPRIKFPR